MATTTREQLLRVALDEFTRAGYAGTSLQRIADATGTSKASVLYHFASKEVLLAAVLEPACLAIEEILKGLEGRPFTRERREAFVVEFVDFLLAHRQAVHIFVNQSNSGVDAPVFERTDALVARIADVFDREEYSVETRIRFGIALAGSAYMLVQGDMHEQLPQPLPTMRAALITVMTELLAPVDQE